MSWFSKNYEKAAIGGAAVVALGMAFLGWSKINNVDNDFATQLKGAGNNDPSVKDADLVAKAKQSLQTARVWDQGDVQGRAVDLFTGIPLFVGRNPADKPVDPGAPGGAPIHPPIPNSWWQQYRLDPGFGDSAQRDADGDGFSNLEEFNAKTDPTDEKDFPSLLAKLKYKHDVSLVWVVRPGFESEGGFTFTYQDSDRATNRATAAAIIKPNDLFFKDGVMKERFKLLGSEVRNVMNPKIKEEQPVTFVRFEDQRPNKAKKIYEIPASFREDQQNLYRQFDRTAVLNLDALGQGGSDFKVEENTTFSLPPSAADKKYLLKSITPESIEVEYKDADGAAKTVQIPKG